MGVKTRGRLIVLLSLVLLVGLSGGVLAQDEDVENGKELFGQYCAVCHGPDGQGRVGATLTDWFVSINPEAFVASTISDGAGTMPAFAQANGGPLSGQQIDDIVAYILSWRERVEPAPTSTPVPVTPIPAVAGVTGDPTAGAQVYARECEICHGERGQGGVGASLSGPIAAAQPAAFLRQAINDGVTGSPMPAFGEVLDGDTVEDIVAFILSWERQPVSPTTTEPDEEGGFNWLVGLLFLVVALVVVGWLVTRFSQRGVQGSQ